MNIYHSICPGSNSLNYSIHILIG